MSEQTLLRWIVAVNIVVAGTCPAIFRNDAYLNVALCILMALSPLLLLFRSCRRTLPLLDIPLGLYALSALLLPAIFHPATLRWSTQFFTAAGAVWFAMMARAVPAAGLNPRRIVTILEWLVAAYAIVLVIQQICVISGLPVFNSGLVYTYAPFKLNSLMTEPSHSSFFLSVMMFYRGLQLRLVQQRSVPQGASLLADLRTRWWVWLAFLWVLFTTCNASAYFWSPLALLPYIGRRNYYYYLSAAAVTLMIVALTPIGQSTQIKRLTRMTTAIVTLDPDSIDAADESIAARVGPSIYGARAVDVCSRDAWTGHGVDADRRDLTPPRIFEEGSAGVFHTWYIYGIVAAISLWIVIVETTFRKRLWPTWIITLVLLLVSSESNWQFFWFPMLLALLTRSNSKFSDRRTVEH